MLKKIADVISPRKKNNEVELLNKINYDNIPQHIAIIMDGNGRWALKRGLPRSAGHRAGVESLKATVKACGKLKVKVLTVYAFSTENWKRPQEEVQVLMNLLSEYISKELKTLINNNIKLMTIGEIDRLPLKAQEALATAVEETKDNTDLILNIALNYGGRSEIVKATKEIIADVENKRLNIDDLDETIFNSYLYTRDLPDPDLLIRPSGELRISNYLLWQLAYTELWITDTLWPDFREKHLHNAIIDYQKRERRYGGLKL